MIPQTIIEKATGIANRYFAIHGFHATTAQFRFIVREIAFRINDRNIAKYGKTAD